MGGLRPETTSRPTLKRRASTYTAESSSKKLRLDFAGTHLDVPPPTMATLEPFARMPPSPYSFHLESPNDENGAIASLRPQVLLTQVHCPSRPTRPFAHHRHRGMPRIQNRQAPLDMKQLEHSIAVASIEEDVPIIIVTSGDDDTEADQCKSVGTNSKSGC